MSINLIVLIGVWLAAIVMFILNIRSVRRQYKPDRYKECDMYHVTKALKEDQRRKAS
jgi:hypothetical protein